MRCFPMSKNSSSPHKQTVLHEQTKMKDWTPKVQKTKTTEFELQTVRNPRQRQFGALRGETTKLRETQIKTVWIVFELCVRERRKAKEVKTQVGLEFVLEKRPEINGDPGYQQLFELSVKNLKTPKPHVNGTRDLDEKREKNIKYR